MSWVLLVVLVFVLGFAFAVAVARRLELRRMQRAVEERTGARERGDVERRLQHPIIDLSRCLGCATCVAVCPEDDVLQLVHGQAMVVNGAHCQGVSACERECPVGAITVTLANLDKREDVPALTPQLEAVQNPGLFLAGEVTAHALIKTAIDHGTAVGAEVARRVSSSPGDDPDEVLDLCVVGAGPSGLACSLEAKRHGLHFVTLDQADGIGGTVAKYPRRKLVVSQAIDLPLHGRLREKSYTKEELMGLWASIAQQHELPIRTGVVFQGVERSNDGIYDVVTDGGRYRARHVCLALGRRGTPRKLGVPGEELSKVAYDLLDASSYRGRRVLVVGGGDSAVEAALALAEQPGNRVTLSYRRESFYRIRTRNAERLEQGLSQSRLDVLFGSEVTAIGPESVDLVVTNGHGPEERRLPNDEVFVMAGGIPPVEVLQRSGVSFDASRLRPASEVLEEGTGFRNALGIGLALALLTLAWALWYRDYYFLPAHERPPHPHHDMLRPGLGVGLWLGIAATGLILVNLAYLLRRAPSVPFRLGSLQAWMTSHVATGVLAFLCVLLHGAMSPGDTVGGHAFWALSVLLVTGAIGRYFYAYVPRAANGRELELAEFRASLGRMSEAWDRGQRQFRDEARREIDALVERRQWRGSFLGRAFALLGVERELRRVVARIAARGHEQGVAEDQIRETQALARRAHRAALMVAHFEDLRAVLNTWRYLHRWVAALMVVLVVLHIGFALTYSAFSGGVEP